MINEHVKGVSNEIGLVLVDAAVHDNCYNRLVLDLDPAGSLKEKENQEF